MQLFCDSKGDAHELPAGVVPTWRISAYALVVEEGQLLLIRSGRSGLWEIPGGGVDLDEFILDGCVREVREETGFDVEVTDRTPFFLKENWYHAFYFSKGFYHGVMVFYRARRLSEVQYEIEISETGEVAEVAWLNLHSIDLETVTPAAREVIALLQNEKRPAV